MGGCSSDLNKEEPKDTPKELTCATVKNNPMNEMCENEVQNKHDPPITTAEVDKGRDEINSEYEEIRTTICEINNQDEIKCVEASGIKERHIRKRVGYSEREFIWNSTQGLCYLCKKYLPKNSPWHIEHILAFSKDPVKNDVLGNMLPSCESCNTRKNNRDLLVVLQKDPTFTLATFAKDVNHLNTAAKQEILYALQQKHDQKASQALQIQQQTHNLLQKEDMIVQFLQEIETIIQDQVITNRAQIVQMNGQQKEIIQHTKLFPHQIDFDEENAVSIGFGGFGNVYLAKYYPQGKPISNKNQQKQVKTPNKHPIKANGNGKGEDEDEEDEEQWLLQQDISLPCAIKLPKIYNATSYQAFVREIEGLEILQHPHIVQYYGWFEYDHPIAIAASSSSNSSGKLPKQLGIALEYCAYCLSELRVMKHIHPIPCFFQLTLALQYIHSLGYIHRDIKPNNILIQKQVNQSWDQAIAKLCDFGSVKHLLESDQQHTKVAGTAAFRPPEFRTGKGDKKSDVYCLGKTIEMVRNENMSMLQMLSATATSSKGGTKGKKKEAIVMDWDVLIKGMCQYNVLNRYDLQQVQDGLYAIQPTHPIFQDCHYIPHNTTANTTAISPTNATNSIDPTPSTPPRYHIPHDDIAPNGSVVYISEKAAHRENPKGNRQNKYHLLDTCCNIKQQHHGKEIPLSEALEFHLQPCKTCCNGTNSAKKKSSTSSGANSPVRTPPRQSQGQAQGQGMQQLTQDMTKISM